MLSEVMQKRFYAKFLVHPRTRCWIWTGAKAHCGYGILTDPITKRPKRAHRWSWIFHHGEIPAGMKVLHKCDTPACVSPEHLFIGTQLDNIRDMVSKGRGNLPAGEKHPYAKLTESEVKEIRSMKGQTQAEIARRFNIRQDTVSRILSRKIWKYVA